MIFSKGKTFLTMLVALVVTALVLAACGDATNTPSAASGASTVTSSSATTAAMTTSSAMTTASATTAAMSPGMAMSPGASMTTAAMTTPAATTSGAAMTTDSSMTTAAMTTSSASTSSGAASFPTVTGLTEVPISSNVTNEINNTLKITGASVKIYSSNDDATTVSTNYDTALTGAGYAFAIPGQTKPIAQGTNAVGLYSKSGSQDILFITTAIPTDATAGSTNLPGLSQQDAQQFLDQLKGKKTAVIAISGNNLLQGLMSLGSSSASMTTSAAMTTVAATPTK